MVVLTEAGCKKHTNQNLHAPYDPWLSQDAIGQRMPSFTDDPVPADYGATEAQHEAQPNPSSTLKHAVQRGAGPTRVTTSSLRSPSRTCRARATLWLCEVREDGVEHSCGRAEIRAWRDGKCRSAFRLACAKGMLSSSGGANGVGVKGLGRR